MRLKCTQSNEVLPWTKYVMGQRTLWWRHAWLSCVIHLILWGFLHALRTVPLNASMFYMYFINKILYTESTMLSPFSIAHLWRSSVSGVAFPVAPQPLDLTLKGNACYDLPVSSGVIHLRWALICPLVGGGTQHICHIEVSSVTLLVTGLRYFISTSEDFVYVILFGLCCTFFSCVLTL